MKERYVAALSQYPQRQLVTWADIHRDSKILVRTIMTLGHWTGIVALTRGGLVPAAIVAREMGIRVVDTLCVSTYDEQNRGEVNILKIPTTAYKINGSGWLLLDGDSLCWPRAGAGTLLWGRTGKKIQRRRKKKTI